MLTEYSKNNLIDKNIMNSFFKNYGNNNGTVSERDRSPRSNNSALK